MKKLLTALGIFSMTLCISCKSDVPPPPIPAATPPVSSPASPTPAPEAPRETEGTSTSISIGKGGINVDSKKTKVTVDENGTAVELTK